jgi:hypothetical protein
MKLNILLIIVILLIVFYHNLIQNDLEKRFFEKYLGYDNVKRPLKKCKKYEKKNTLSCVGMPSGHAETITILSGLLYYYKFISLWLCFTLILIFSFERITSNAHTLQQVFVGILFGYGYLNIYTYFNLSIYSFLIVASIGLILYFLTFT